MGSKVVGPCTKRSLRCLKPGPQHEQSRHALQNIDRQLAMIGAVDTLTHSRQSTLVARISLTRSVNVFAVCVGQSDATKQVSFSWFPFSQMMQVRIRASCHDMLLFLASHQAGEPLDLKQHAILEGLGWQGEDRRSRRCQI